MTDESMSYLEALKEIKRLKEALEQKPCEDAVSRQAVDELSKELVHTTRDKADFLCNFWEGLQKLPSVTPKEKTAAMTRYTDGLEEGIRCAMCTNPMANDRGCDGGCVVNESMYQNVLNVIKKHFLEQQPCEDAISRKDMLAIFRQSNSLSQAWNGFEKLPPVTPKSKSEYEHDHEVVKAYNDGQAFILDKIKAEIEGKMNSGQWSEAVIYGMKKTIAVIDKYRGE